MVELWRPVVGFEGSYEVSSLGRIRNVARLDTAGRQIPSKVMTNAHWAGRYMRVRFRQGGRTVERTIHHLGAWSRYQATRRRSASVPRATVADAAPNSTRFSGASSDTLANMYARDLGGKPTDYLPDAPKQIAANHIEMEDG